MQGIGVKLSNLKVAIIDYGLCNLFSVVSACKHIGVEPIISSKRSEIMSCDAAILPGVGAFGAAINSIRQLGLDITIKEFVATKKPFMGICLGLHLLFDRSEEFGDHQGLGVVPGVVKRLPESCKKVPQISWNRIFHKSSAFNQGHILKGLDEGEFMYFVHSFYVKPLDPSVVLTSTNYEGFSYCSSIMKENLVAFQFHPEKSALEGLKIYENFKKSIIRRKDDNFRE